MVKKRASNRRGRPGGVMARPMKCKAARSGRIFAAANAVHGPRGTLAPRRCARRAEARSPRRSRGWRRARTRAPCRRSARCNRFIRCASACGSSGRATGMRRSTGSTRPPGNTNLPGHELVALRGACRAAPWARVRSGRPGSASPHPSAAHRARRGRGRPRSSA